MACEITADRRRWTGGTKTSLSARCVLTPQRDAVPLLMNGKNSAGTAVLIISCVRDRYRIAETGGSATPHTLGNAFNRFRRRGSQQVPDFLEFCLNLFPGRIWSMTKQLALCLVFEADDLGEFWRRKQGVAFGEAHPFRIEIASRKVFAADRIVIFLY